MGKTTTTGWKTLDEVAAKLGLTMGADGELDTSGLGRNEAKLVNDLYALAQNRDPSVGENYQIYNPAAEQKNILREKLKKYTGVVGKRYGLSNEGALDNTVLKAQRDAARRIDADVSTTAGGGSGGYDLDAEAEAIFEKYYKATGGGSGASAKVGAGAKTGTAAGTQYDTSDMRDGEEEIVNELLGEYQKGMNSEDKWGLSERIYSSAYGGIDSEAAYKMLSEGIAELEKTRPDTDIVDEILAKFQNLRHTASKDAILGRVDEMYDLTKEERQRLVQELDTLYKKDGAYDELIDAVNNGTIEYMKAKEEELIPYLSAEELAEYDKYLEEYLANDDEKSREANEWYVAAGEEDASVEDLRLILDKFPNASDHFRLALFDLIEEKERAEALDEYKEGKTEKEANEEVLDGLIESTAKTKDMTAKDATDFLEAIDEYLNEDGELDTSKVSQEWWDKNMADRYAEVLEEFGPYFEKKEKTYERQLAGERAIPSEDGKEWYILRSAENDATDFLEEHWEEADDALEEQGYDNLENPRIPDGVIIKVEGARLIRDGGQWRYVTNDKNAYKSQFVVGGVTHLHSPRRELTAADIEKYGLDQADKGKAQFVKTGGNNGFYAIYFDGKWHRHG